MQLDWGAGRGKGGSRITPSQAGRTAPPFSYSQAFFRAAAHGNGRDHRRSTLVQVSGVPLGAV